MAPLFARQTHKQVPCGAPFHLELKTVITFP